ncbi:MAG: hypothetical protein CM15mP49_05130 [Actinomycetota bacterium]|nr:MAG: hypothetical protein CM15mP49_05130 [Actinomycetota bacterium]
MSPKSLKAFEKIQDNGVTILIATGRRFRIVADTLQILVGVFLAFCSMAHCVMTLLFKEIVFHLFFQQENTEILKILNPMTCHQLFMLTIVMSMRVTRLPARDILRQSDPTLSWSQRWVVTHSD